MGKNVAIKDGSSIRVSKDKFITETELQTLFSQLGLDLDIDSLYKSNPYASYDFGGINIHIQSNDIHFTKDSMMNYICSSVLNEDYCVLITEDSERIIVEDGEVL